jgi:hypothetical protein
VFFGGAAGTAVPAFYQTAFNVSSSWIIRIGG